MEDIIALVLVVGVFAAFAWGVRIFRKRMQMEKQRKEQQRIASEKYWEDERNKRVAKVNAQRIDQRNMESYVSALGKAKNNTPPKPQTRTYTSSTSTTSTTPVSRSSDDDGFLTGMLTGYALNALTHKSESSSSSSGSSSSSSWGFDDADSRKSISSSMSDSWSSSSSSDSWSSSDSGPSSDW